MDPRVNQLAADSLQEQGKQPKLKMPENQAGCERAGFRVSTASKAQRRTGIESATQLAGELAADSLQKQQKGPSLPELFSGSGRQKGSHLGDKRDFRKVGHLVSDPATYILRHASRR